MMITVFTDGASSGNPGYSGAGIYINDQGHIYEHAIPLGYMSNHEAEFHAVIKALEFCNKKFPNNILAFQTDSQIVVDTIEKNHTKNKAFQPLLNQIQSKAKKHPHFFIKWIPANQNNQADKLAKQAVQKN